MARIRFFHHCKIVLLSTLIIAVAAGVCGLFWLNQQGFGGEWGDRIEAELSQRGVHADFQEARYSPLRGILVREAIFYSDEAKTKVFARIPDLLIDIDRSKALRGELLLRELVLRGADIDVPLVSTPDQPTVAPIRQLSGSVTVDRQGRFILRDGTGTLGGMRFQLNAELDEFELRLLAGHSRDSVDENRARFIQNLFAKLARWKFDPNRPPTLDLRLTGNFSKPSTIRTSFSLDAAELSFMEYTMERVHLAGEFLGRRLNLDTFQFSDGAGDLTGEADYDLKSRTGRYELRSTLHLTRLLRTCLDYHGLDDIVSPQAPTVVAGGSFQVAPDGAVLLGATGKLKLPEFRFLGTSFEQLETEFSWQNGDMFLRDLHVTHRDGVLKGRVMIQGDTIRYSADSTLPATVFTPFIIPDSGLAKIIAKAEFTKTSTIHLVADGTIRRSNLKEWASNGTARLTNITFGGVPIQSAQAEYSMTPVEHRYSKIAAVFDYSDYALQRRHGGPTTGLVRAERISHDRQTRLTRIVNLNGTAWPGPVLRLFAPKVADHIEQSYRFRSPPKFSSDGLVGHGGTAPLTDVQTSLRANSTTGYTFLERDLPLENVTAMVRYRHNRVDVSDLRCRCFDGPIGGDLRVDINPGKPASFSGGFHGTRLRFASIGDTFDFGRAEQGDVTGRLDITGIAGNVRALNGTGALGLEHGHLFFVPILGPLSPVLGEILGDKRASHEEARDASCTFAIKNGVFLTRDFLTSTPSTVFTGEGSIDLQQKSIDFTVRMNARGLFGLITLPLRPFNGLFQFRGQGLVRAPVWKSAPFIPPPDGKDDPLFRKARRAVLIPED